MVGINSIRERVPLKAEASARREAFDLAALRNEQMHLQR
jgi:hypothetical protein